MANGKVHVSGTLYQASLLLRFRAVSEWSIHHYHLTLTLTFTGCLLYAGPVPTLPIMISALAQSQPGNGELGIQPGVSDSRADDLIHLTLELTPPSTGSTLLSGPGHTSGHFPAVSRYIPLSRYTQYFLE